MPKLISVPEDLQGVTRFDVQFRDIEPVNELFSKCVIRILYPGLNQNDVYIEKEVAEEMIKTLYNIPVVGEYIETIEDFKGHGGIIEITDDDIKFIQTTKPYGFVPEDTTVSWENVRENDGTVREYLTCTAYLWTGRYPEVMSVIEEGRPQSMELDEETLEGYWKKEGNKTIFHITQAQFSALCILGKDVPPAFESASIGSYYVANPIGFSKRFGKLLRDYEQLKPVVNFSSAKNDKKENNKEGGQDMTLTFKLNMDEDNIKHSLYDSLNPEENEERVWKYSIATVNVDNKEFTVVEEATNNIFKRYYEVGEDDVITITETQEPITLVEYVENDNDNDKQELEKLQQKYDKLQADFEEMKNSTPEAKDIVALKEENKALKEFKVKVEKEEKEKIIDKFSNVLTEEDIKPFKEGISDFSKESLEEKLAVIAVRKINFSKESPLKHLVPDPKNNNNLSDVEKIIKKHQE